MGLQHKKILITRDMNQAIPLQQKITHLGGRGLIADVLTIDCMKKTAIQKVGERLREFAWFFFTSANGVHCFFNSLNELNIEDWRHIHIAAVGTKTEAALEMHGITVDFIPSIYNAKTMAEEFLNRHPYPGKLLLIRGSKSRPELVETLTENDHDVEQLTVYQTTTNWNAQQKLDVIFRDHPPHYVTFMSPSAVDAFCELMTAPVPEDTIIACIGTTTAEKAYEKGFRELLVPETFTIEGMLHIMSEHAEKGEYET